MPGRYTVVGTRAGISRRAQGNQLGARSRAPRRHDPLRGAHLSGAELILRDPLGERPLAASDFPISIGGPGHTIVFGDLHTADAAAWIAWHDGQLFLQPAADGPPVLCNGAAVKRSTWLREGDVIDIARGRLRLGTTGGTPTLAIEDGSGGNLTLPPDAPSAALVSGGNDEADEELTAVAFRRPDAAPAGAPAHCATCGRRLRVRPARAGDMVPVHGTSGAHRYGAGSRCSTPAGRCTRPAHRRESFRIARQVRAGGHAEGVPHAAHIRAGHRRVRPESSLLVAEIAGTPARGERRTSPDPCRGPRTRPCARRIQVGARSS